MSKHTPGPWYVTTCTVGESCWCRCISTNPDSDELEDCIIPSGAVSEANARLIAAAPELLKELSNVADWLDRPDERALSDSDVANIRAAIAKATGEQP